MKIAIGSDEATELTTFLTDELQRCGHTIIRFSPLAPNDPEVDWPLTSSHVAEAVVRGDADEGILCCWTGTGASIAHRALIMFILTQKLILTNRNNWYTMAFGMRYDV